MLLDLYLRVIPMFIVSGLHMDNKRIMQSSTIHSPTQGHTPGGQAPCYVCLCALVSYYCGWGN